MLLCGWLIAGCGGQATSTATSRRSTSSHHPARRRPPPSRGTLPQTPGTLPQTAAVPSADTRTFSAEMLALWRGIRTDSVRQALPAFFPEAAYAQLKGIANPGGDWQGRLVADYRLDIGAAHGLLGPHAAQARLMTVQVPASNAHWIRPGVCDNTVGYWEVPNTRVVYRSAGEIRSFGIASMISWRGVWYVVHLGAVLRSAAAGVVDDPAVGPGASAYSSTC